MSAENNRPSLKDGLKFREVLREGDILVPSIKYLGDSAEIAFKVNKIYRHAGDKRFIAAVAAKTLQKDATEGEESDVVFRRGSSVTDLSYQNYGVIRFGRNK